MSHVSSYQPKYFQQRYYGRHDYALLIKFFVKQNAPHKGSLLGHGLLYTSSVYSKFLSRSSMLVARLRHALGSEDS